jgi:quercetin dioxygenase-like cupin family protein
VLFGDPGKDGMFAFRLKVPKDYRIGPHTHPRPEIVTVITGSARLGMGSEAKRESAKVLPAGSFFALTPGSVHYFLADEDTVIQLNSTGPWGITYVDPKDDPRQTTGAAPDAKDRPAK